ncbi:MAG: DUF192 domain-containing protein [Candidatus Liptonbacteria bacterium]|nr:DUF192 domain-containing protein [Candidatus Liptonbacteria bacterium]
MSRSLSVTLFIILICIALIATLVIFYAASLRPNPQLRKTEIMIGTNTFNVEVASTTLELARGLSGREGLAPGTGMLFLFNGIINRPGIQHFWMKDMRFPLDIIWISGDKVVGFSENVPPPASGTSSGDLVIYNSPDNTDKVLEVNAGTVEKGGIKVGDPAVVKNL